MTIARLVRVTNVSTHILIWITVTHLVVCLLVILLQQTHVIRPGWEGLRISAAIGAGELPNPPGKTWMHPLLFTAATFTGAMLTRHLLVHDQSNGFWFVLFNLTLILAALTFSCVFTRYVAWEKLLSLPLP